MSVYTEVSAEDLQDFLARFHVGQLRSFRGIRDGIENTNYFVTTTEGEHVLTLFEYMAEPAVETALGYMTHLAQNGLPCAMPCADQHGRRIGRLHDKPASLVRRLRGRSEHAPTATHCQTVGSNLARLHLAGQSLDHAQPNPRGSLWRQTTAIKIRPRLTPDQRSLLDDELRYQQQEFSELPHGLIHADLFRDNVLFSGETLTGLVDLSDAGHDLLLYDLAITVSDWCSLSAGGLDTPRLMALLHGYTELRPVTSAEQDHWPILLRRAALRFWLSRLDTLYFPRSGPLTRQKDPDTYRLRLLHYRQYPQTWPI